MRITNRNRRRVGFTLIEAMCASVVLAFCVVGVCGLLVSAMQNQVAAQSRGTASSAAIGGMESLAAKSLDDISSETGTAQSETIDDNLLRRTGDADLQGRLKYLRRDSKQSDRDLAMIQITATAPDGQTVTLYRLATRAEMP